MNEYQLHNFSFKHDWAHSEFDEMFSDVTTSPPQQKSASHCNPSTVERKWKLFLFYLIKIKQNLMPSSYRSVVAQMADRAPQDWKVPSSNPPFRYYASVILSATRNDGYTLAGLTSTSSIWDPLAVLCIDNRLCLTHVKDFYWGLWFEHKMWKYSQSSTKSNIP